MDGTDGTDKGNKVRFLLELTTDGSVAARGVDLSDIYAEGDDLDELRGKLTAAVRAHYGHERPVSMLVGSVFAQPGRG
jgi:hypothetical protein